MNPLRVPLPFRCRRWTVRLAACLSLTCSAAPAATSEHDAAPRFTDQDVARILALGPWPQPARPDPGNRVSGDAAAAAFGRRLFFDGRLSATGVVSCAWCHQPDRAWTDGRARAQALAAGDRNTQSLLNVGLQRWFGWGGSSDSLWMASLRAIVDPREMGSSAARVAREMRRHADLSCEYRVVFGRAVPDDDETVLTDVGKALAAFQQTLVTGRTPFDAFRDALQRGDRRAMARYPAAAQRGLKLFVGRGNCVLCHHGPNFSNGEFHDTGVPFFVRPGVVDPGRFAGLNALRASPYNLLGRHNDDPTGASAIATRHVVQEHRHWGQWRTPSLRSVAQTAPYMHDGSLATLEDVIDHYSTLDPDRLHGDGEALLVALRLTPAERADLLAFLVSLSESEPRPLPGEPPVPAQCP